MPDLYDPHRSYAERSELYDDTVDDDFGSLGAAIVLTIASFFVIPILVGFRAYDWIRDRRKLGRDVHRLLR